MLKRQKKKIHESAGKCRRFLVCPKLDASFPQPLLCAQCVKLTVCTMCNLNCSQILSVACGHIKISNKSNRLRYIEQKLSVMRLFALHYIELWISADPEIPIAKFVYRKKMIIIIIICRKRK